jgi:uncharacterized damage-inducible protein DinB
MINASILNDLFRHMEWADASVWGSVLDSEQASSDAKLREYLYHLHLVQRAFLRVWRGEPRYEPYPTFGESGALMLWGRSYYAEARERLAGWDDEALSRPLPIPWSAMVEGQIGRKPETTILGETALQVALHTTYHRGQVNARLREVGASPPLVDYIVWVWLGRPAAGWPSADAAARRTGE